MILDRRVVSLSLAIASLPLTPMALAQPAPSYKRLRQASRAMLPTLQRGDRVRFQIGEAAVDARNQSHIMQLKRGDLVAFVDASWNNALIIFRLLAFPGRDDHRHRWRRRAD